MEYCPNCQIIELERVEKMFLKRKNWLICPKCGFRKLPEKEKNIIGCINSFIRRRKGRNKRNSFKE